MKKYENDENDDENDKNDDKHLFILLNKIIITKI